MLVALLVILFVPIERYHPSCRAGRENVQFSGPMREEYIAWLTEGLHDDEFSYLRFGDDVFVRIFYPVRMIGEPRLFETLNEYLINHEWRFVRNIIDGYRADGTRGDPPQVLRGLSIRLKDSGRTDFALFSDCEVMRAAMIRVEDLTPEQRRRVIPKSPLPFRCYARHVRDPDNFDPRCGDLTDSVVGGRYLP